MLGTGGLTMVKKIRICDVCGKKMPNFSTTYKFKRIWFNGFGKNIKVEEMCRECYSDFKTFLRQKRGADNG